MDVRRPFLYNALHDFLTWILRERLPVIYRKIAWLSRGMFE